MTGGVRGVKHRQHSDEFKAEAVRRATEPGVAVAHVAKELTLSSSLLARWIRQAQGTLYPSDYQKKKGTELMTTAKSRFYSAEFKAEAVRRALEPGAIIAHIAEEMDVSGYSISAWVRAAQGRPYPSDYQKKGSAAANPAQSGGGVVKRDEEIARLREQVAKLTRERDALKKTLAHYLTEDGG